MIPKLKVGVESNTWSVVTPVQSISRQWHSGSEYTAIVNSASLSTLALFTAILHHRLQWGTKIVKTLSHIHRSGVTSSLLHPGWVHDALTLPPGLSTSSPPNTSHMFLLWLFTCVDFRTVCVWYPIKGFIPGRGEVSSSASFTSALWHLLTWLTSCIMSQATKMDSGGCSSKSGQQSVINLRGNDGGVGGGKGKGKWQLYFN